MRTSFGTAASAAVAALALSASAASAQGPAGFPDDSGHRSVSVAYADLDLGSKRGIDELHRRIDGAVNRLCAAVAAEPLGIHGRARCRARGLAEAGEQLRRSIGEAAARRLAAPRSAARAAD